MQALNLAEPGHPPATLSDVARAAGVSMATASRVVNGVASRVPISAATRERVLRAVDALGYRPNLTARSLSRRHTQTVGLVLPQGAWAIHSAYHARIIAGIADTLAARGYSLALYFSDYGATHSGASYVRALQDGRVDGGLVVDSHVLDDGQLAALESEASRLPIVLVGHRLPGRQLHCIAGDDRGGAAAAVEHLVALGHRRIAHLCNLRGHPAAERSAGYRQALARHGLDPRPEWLIPGDPARDLAPVMRRPGRPTAVLAWNDFTALAAVRALHDVGLRVPEDVSVVGYGDFEVAALTLPALTTVRAPLYESGALGAEVLLDLLAGAPSPAADAAPVPPVQRVLPATLVVRELTGRPPGRPRPARAGVAG